MSNNNENKSKTENIEEVDVSINNTDEEVNVIVEDKNQKQDGETLQTEKSEEKIIDQLKMENLQLTKALDRMKLENEANLRNQEKQLTKQIELRKLSSEIRFYSKFLDIMDNFERAFNNNNSKHEKSDEGFRLIFDQMKQILESEGIKKVHSIGNQFDPNKHEAIAIIESSDHPNATIVDEIQSCFIKNDGIILRAAKVIVSKLPLEENTKKEEITQKVSIISENDKNNNNNDDTKKNDN